MSMRKTKIDLPNRFYTFYGLILGTFVLGLQRRSKRWFDYRLIVAKNILRGNHQMYGVFTGGRFLGWSTFPKHTRNEIREALVRLAKADTSYLHDVLKFDVDVGISAAHYRDAEAVLENTFDWSKASGGVRHIEGFGVPGGEESKKGPFFTSPQNWLDSRGSRRKSKSTRKTQLNLVNIKTEPKIRKQLAALQYQAGVVTTLEEQLEVQRATLERMQKAWEMAKD